MGRSLDLLQLDRLAALCDLRHRLAMQGEAHAAAEARTATRRRMEGAVAVTEAERSWQGAVGSSTSEPEFATALGEVLIARAAMLITAIDHEAQCRQSLAMREDARIEARARSRQTGEVIAHARRTLRRRADEQLLTMTDDRTTNRWRRT